MNEIFKKRKNLFIILNHKGMKLNFFLILFLLQMQCSKYDKCAYDTYLVPHSIFFIVNKSHQRLDDNTLNSIKLFYYKDVSKVYVNDFIRGSEEAYNLGVLTSRDIGSISGDEGIKDFYLEYTGGDIDTLFVDYKKLNQEDACNHPCKCNYPLESVKFNGVAAIPDTSIKVQKVYLFNKE